MTKKLMGVAYIKKGRAECRDYEEKNLHSLEKSGMMTNGTKFEGKQLQRQISEIRKIIAEYDEPMYVNPKPICPIDGELMRDHTKDELIECWLLSVAPANPKKYGFGM